MNYDEVAERVVDDLIASGSMHIKDGFVPLIRDALRRAANEAAWGAYDMLGNGVGPDEWYKKYGPRPEGGTR